MFWDCAIKRPSRKPHPANPDKSRRSLLRRACCTLLIAFSPALYAERVETCRLANYQQPAPSEPTLVIIIDDVGHQLRAGRAVAELPGQVTLAVLPYTPHGANLAREAHLRGKEIMLHAPMSNLGNLPVGPGALTPYLSAGDFRATLNAALAKIPYVRGINNHMGSELTQRPQQMNWVMEVLQARNLFFVDSRTSPKTVAASAAARHGIPHLSRHVFLDNERLAAAIDQRFQEALRRARREGLSVVIGHPYPETIAYLQQALPQLPAQGVRLASVSQVLGLPQAVQLASATEAAGNGY
jgi:polysaccharide deacetylase 2 family uncharacterized protein YibQ